MVPLPTCSVGDGELSVAQTLHSAFRRLRGAERPDPSDGEGARWGAAGPG